MKRFNRATVHPSADGTRTLCGKTIGPDDTVTGIEFFPVAQCAGEACSACSAYGLAHPQPDEQWPPGASLGMIPGGISDDLAPEQMGRIERAALRGLDRLALAARNAVAGGRCWAILEHPETSPAVKRAVASIFEAVNLALANPTPETTEQLVATIERIADGQGPRPPCH